MSLPLEDYAMIGDLETAALVCANGSIDWFCLPRFDGDACFAALLGEPDHGRWLIAPTAGGKAARRRYRPGTLVLESDFETDEGAVRIVDCMPPRHGVADVVRVVEGLRGRVEMELDLRIRFDFGSVLPWIRRTDDGRIAVVAGPDALVLDGDVEVEHRDDRRIVCRFAVEEGDRVGFVLSWYRSHLALPDQDAPAEYVERTTGWWEDWSSQCTYQGRWADEVLRSLVVLKALTYDPTGGIVAAPTTSLPEKLGGVRNWDYRFCWVRDATLSLQALLLGGYVKEACAWRDWLLRAVAGDPSSMQIMYGPAGERRLHEHEVPWLPGYEHSKPVRTGNAASEQFQLDVYGELMDAMHQARNAGMAPDESAWTLQRELLDHLEGAWKDPDAGIWEVRGPLRDFTHSKVMAWVAFDRGARTVEETDVGGPSDRWRRIAHEIREEVLREGYDAERGTFTQFYGSEDLDASLLMIPLVGFLPADDERMTGTIEAIRRELCDDGFVLRYPPREGVDGLPPGEGCFLPCTLWLVDNLFLAGRHGEARELFEKVLAVRNDVGLLAEEYDTASRRMVGNFPQAFSHMELITSARNLSAEPGGPAEERSEDGDGRAQRTRDRAQ